MPILLSWKTIKGGLRKCQIADSTAQLMERLAANGQQPETLVITCSDSRISLEYAVGMEAGELFVTRNIGNIVQSIDASLNSVLHYAINVLNVKDIVVIEG